MKKNISKEIEVKLKYKNKEKIVRLIRKLGAKFKEKYELHDTYLGFHKTMSNKYELVRIREKGNSSELTFKGKCKDKNNVWERIELNCGIRDPEHMMDILEQIGLVRIKENISLREAHLLDGLEICFIDFKKPARLSIIELEGPEDNINRLLIKLGDFVERAGEDIFTRFDKE